MDWTIHDLTKEQGVRELTDIQPLAEAVNWLCNLGWSTELLKNYGIQPDLGP